MVSPFEDVFIPEKIRERTGNSFKTNLLDQFFRNCAFSRSLWLDLLFRVPKA